LRNIDGIILISTDKAKIPKKILEIASKLNVGIYFPDKDIPLKKKKKFYEDEKLKHILNNNHEVDAYIAAYFALEEIKEIIEKARRIAKNEREYIEILKLSLKNRKIEPFSAKEILEEKKKGIEISKKIRKKSIKRKKAEDIPEIRVEIKTENKEDYKKMLEEHLKKYIDLLTQYDELSNIILEKVKDERIIPKISFLIKKNKSYDKVFVDEFSEESKKYIVKNKPKVFVKEEDLEKISGISKEINVVLKYRELKNFVIVEEYTTVKDERNIDIDKLKRIIDSLRYGKVL